MLRSKAPQNQSLNPHDLSLDLAHLKFLNPQSLKSLLPNKSTSSLETETAGNAKAQLSSFSTSKAKPEESLSLSRAYLQDMRNVRKWDDGRIERLGEEIDQVRRAGGEVRDALGEVKIGS